MNSRRSMSPVKFRMADQPATPLIAQTNFRPLLTAAKRPTATHRTVFDSRGQTVPYARSRSHSPRPKHARREIRPGEVGLEPDSADRPEVIVWVKYRILPRKHNGVLDCWRRSGFRPRLWRSAPWRDLKLRRALSWEPDVAYGP